MGNDGASIAVAYVLQKFSQIHRLEPISVCSRKRRQRPVSTSALWWRRFFGLRSRSMLLTAVNFPRLRLEVGLCARDTAIGQYVHP